jgi:hypothetical protein
VQLYVRRKPKEKVGNMRPVAVDIMTAQAIRPAFDPSCFLLDVIIVDIDAGIKDSDLDLSTSGRSSR